MNPFTGCTECYDFSTSEAAAIKTAFIAYALYMMNMFTPIYVNHAVEVTTYLANCDQSLFLHVIEFANEVQ